MPISNEDAGVDKKQAAINEAQRRLYTTVFRNCTDEIREHIRAGSHVKAWDCICDGPDAGRWYRHMTYDGKDIAYSLSVTERVKMSGELTEFARVNGWDEAASDAMRKAYMADVRKAAGRVGVRGAGRGN